MPIQAHLNLALSRLWPRPGAWLAWLAAACLGPALHVFGESAPIWDQHDARQLPWIFLMGLVGAVLGMSLTENTQVMRRSVGSPLVGDLILVATPTVLLIATATLSLAATSGSPPLVSCLTCALHLTALAVLLLPLGPIALIAAAWLLPAFLPAQIGVLLDPLAHQGTPGAQLTLFAALILLSALKPHAIRHTR